ncbi:hypothetical protein [Streptomyces sp. NPDC049906]|uniref:hypothetical protein n=1 Tax=Streptomyces sp. NPDC049906 TaxID=3155656 RepID=UPI0034154872
MNGPRVTRSLAAAVLGGLALVTPALAAPAQEEWVRTGDGITAGISGIAVVARGAAGVDTVVVHDNKRPGEPRISRIGLVPGSAPVVRVLRWQGGDRDPVDLESLSPVPGAPGELVALESSGHGFHLRLTGDTAQVLREFAVPGADAVDPAGHRDNYEAFFLAGTPGRLTAVWAHRGQDTDPAVLHAAALDWTALAFGARDSAPVRVPYPAAGVRHVSDLTVSPTGRVTVTSASDAGDDGPFDSAVYDVGRVESDLFGRPRPVLRDAPLRIAVFPGHKIEALACGPAAQGVLGTDDENAGGRLRAATVCPL